MQTDSRISGDAPQTSARTDDLRVRRTLPLVTPRALKKDLPAGESVLAGVTAAREAVRRILRSEDDRMLVVVGPCSIHDPDSALDYARRLKELSEQVADRYCIVMRVYFEKPRTTLGWKGLINDPLLNGTNDIAHGLRLARELMLEIAGLGLPVATEFLDPIVPQYLTDLVSWAAIGARTTESQTHREMASGLSMPVGFKNNTEGQIQIALDAMLASQNPHSFLGIDQDGVTSIIQTRGNPYAHLVLRGGKHGANYKPEHTEAAAGKLRAAGMRPKIMVDCSHANANKIPARQVDVWRSVRDQHRDASSPVMGAMLESFLQEGNQALPPDGKGLDYGLSITDPCIDWATTESILTEEHPSRHE